MLGRKEIRKMAEYSVCHERGTKKKSESPTGFEPMTNLNRCTGGHGFDSGRGLGFFLCPTLVTN